MRRRAPLAARLGGLIPYAVLLGAAAYLYANAGSFGAVARAGELGPDFWPRAVLGLLMLVCAGAIVRGLAFAPPVRDPDRFGDARPDAEETEIGRASCRERVGSS